MFDNLKSQFEAWTKLSLEQIVKEVNHHYGIPETDGNFVLFRTFDLSESPIGRGGISVENNSWKIEAYDSGLLDNESDKPIRRAKLFTFKEPDDLDCVIMCRAWVKTSRMNQTARLRLGYEKESEFFGIRGAKTSQYYETSINSSQWQEYQVKHCFRKDKYPTNFYLDIDFYESGTAWIRDISLFTAPIYNGS